MSRVIRKVWSEEIQTSFNELLEKIKDNSKCKHKY